ncbi:hypothetical protein PtrSN002B_010202 [Pyrenophora tritici-repentis]|uniref:Uncharacterized protein n=2 Tax=Pyrenophora tritici-repentis TaxID=45151 RepID=A0A2W1HV42_9PLEO|nr:uncharacterized protein PTRG_07531 [Pyrenophora tritici-repentis Pt-1C-BFP]KAA8617179.1 hypothetical protein PtrV1_10480 [Pyrenophora tritici-repentis]EDU50450.1 predicted protein [Pyrenophora tritici-repentis Pt-1C-BFP]KAF7446460.1 hypothetical protein A1F99_097510 [Pyrenophora tritici-repentis]KAF7567575.1 hypothetical protein PtrM4_141660 [Pyrenophora tritici-repentis]KAG9382159.1 hypothetical protein A1F94_007813 [Pyrenophora tritici-repentis]
METQVGDQPLHQPATQTDFEAIKMQDTYDALTLENQVKCPILRLPGEIRNKVYGYVFDDVKIKPGPWYQNPVTKKYSKDLYGSYGLELEQRSKFFRNKHLWYPRERLSLLQTCRQINAEAKLFPFAAGTLQGDDYFINDVIWRVPSKAQANAITTVELVRHYQRRAYQRQAYVRLLYDSGMMDQALRKLGELRGVKKLVFCSLLEDIETERLDHHRDQCFLLVGEVLSKTSRGAEIEVAITH